jgi:hypothetical protein
MFFIFNINILKQYKNITKIIWKKKRVPVVETNIAYNQEMHSHFIQAITHIKKLDVCKHMKLLAS